MSDTSDLLSSSLTEKKICSAGITYRILLFRPINFQIVGREMIVDAGIVTSSHRRLIIYAWIVVLTQSTIVSNSALNPSMVSKSKMFRTVLSSSQQHINEHTISSTNALELVPFNSEVTESLQPLIIPIPPDALDASSPKPTSPLRTRFGLFRRKLMDDVSIVVVPAAAVMNNNINLTTTTPPSTTTTTTMLAASSTGGTSILVWNKFSFLNYFRGGATGTSSSGSSTGVISILSTLFQTIFVQNFCRFANFIGTTKARCFCLLVFCVIIESYATTLSKQAKDTGNSLLFARACLVYILWYVVLVRHWKQSDLELSEYFLTFYLGSTSLVWLDLTLA
jgi:hypothetical protein